MHATGQLAYDAVSFDYTVSVSNIKRTLNSQCLYAPWRRLEGLMNSHVILENIYYIETYLRVFIEAPMNGYLTFLYLHFLT